MSRSYQFRAARADGSLVRGTIEAATGSQAAALLLDRGLHIVEVAESEAVDVRRPARRKELVVVFRSLATLVTAGVRLEHALACSESLSRGALRQCVGEARSRLQEGRTLAQALDSGRGTVPRLVLGMLRAGERAGRLGETLEHVATHLELEADLANRLRYALAHPALLVTAGIASMLVIGTVVIPKFATLLDEVGQELPPLARLLFMGSTLVTQHWPVLLACILATGWAVALWLRHPSGKLHWHQVLLLVPVAGRIRHELATARVARALSGGLEAGMPLLPALEVATGSAGDREIGARLARARQGVASGEPLTSALARESALTSTALQLIAVGEESGQLATMVGRAGDLAARQAERALFTLVSVLEPALVILLGGFVAFVAAALLQAIYGLRPGGI